MKIITHLSVYKIAEHGVFDHVNSYEEMNAAIKRYGQLNSESDEAKKLAEYKKRVGEAFEVYTQFFTDRPGYGNSPLLGILKVLDTSDDPYQAGFDFMFESFDKKPGQLQSKWRSDPLYTFKIGKLATNGEVARNHNIDNDKNILFLNINDHENLFDYKYRQARVGRRIIDRKIQEEFIRRDPEFWNDFRKAIRESAKIKFKTVPKLRDVQEWILRGHKSGETSYSGTVAVLNGSFDKGRVAAATATGKTLCQFLNVRESLFDYGKKIAAVVMPTLNLIDQTFDDFYRYKLFTMNVSCLVIRSGPEPRCNRQITDILQTLEISKAVEFIEDKIANGRKVVLFITNDSHDNKYEAIVRELAERGLRIGLEVVDEFHNMVTDSGDREKQELKAEFLRNNELRADGTIFYSASNRHGQILSTFDESLFGPLLAKVEFKDLRERAFVSPRISVRLVTINETPAGMEIRRESERIGLDFKVAQVEAAGIIVAFRDATQFYSKPNLLTFGNHVEGSRHISMDPVMNEFLPGVNQHFMSGDTDSRERARIFNEVRDNGGKNIIHQHSVAKEGVNIPSLHGIIVNRGMSLSGTQQSLGRSGRADQGDTEKFQSGTISLDNPNGWTKYYNLMYVISDGDSKSVYNRVREIVRYLVELGIPKEAWDISPVMDKRGGVKPESNLDFAPHIDVNVAFDKKQIDEMIGDAELEIAQNEQMEQELEFRKKIRGMSDDDLDQEFADL